MLSYHVLYTLRLRNDPCCNADICYIDKKHFDEISHAVSPVIKAKNQTSKNRKRIFNN